MCLITHQRKDHSSKQRSANFNNGYVCEPNSISVADALVDFFNNKREIEFVKGVKDEKKKLAKSRKSPQVFIPFRQFLSLPVQNPLQFFH